MAAQAYRTELADFSFGQLITTFSPSIFEEILSVHKQANAIYTNIKDSPNHILGAEILKKFLIDLLGRDSDEAKIFETSIESNLKATQVVSIYLKVATIFLMVALNIYFVYMSVLLCSDKNFEWQITW